MSFGPDFRDPEAAEWEGYERAEKDFKKKMKAQRARYKRKINLMQKEIDSLKKKLNDVRSVGLAAGRKRKHAVQSKTIKLS